MKRYRAELVYAIDDLIARIEVWEDEQFSASAVEISTAEAQKVAAYLIRDLLIAGFSDPLGIDGGKLMEVLSSIRGGDGDD